MGVEWGDNATEDLLAIFERPDATESDWLRLAESAAAIRSALGVNPLSLGESREAGHRIWFEGVLAVGFQVLNDDDVVVTHVVALRGRGG